MKSSKNIFQFRPGKQVFMLIALIVSSLLLVQCDQTNAEDFGMQEDIKEHFGDMNYVKTIFVEDISLGDGEVDFQSGTGLYQDHKGEEGDYKWVYLIGPNGDLLTGYIGANTIATTTIAELTKGETEDALKRCGAIDEVNDRFACFDRVVDAVFDDCYNSILDGTKEDCIEQCWFSDGLCDVSFP